MNTKNPYHYSPQPVKKNYFKSKLNHSFENDARSTISAVSSVRNNEVTRKTMIGNMDEDNEIGSIYGDYSDVDDGPQVLKK